MADYLQPLPGGSAAGGAADSAAAETVQPSDFNRLVGVLNGTAGTVGTKFFAANPPGPDWGNETFNVKSISNPAGPAKGDAQFAIDGVMTAASAVLTSASNKFAIGDVGKLCCVGKAGPLIANPSVALLAADGGVGGSTLPTGNYTFVYTWFTGFGETTIGTSTLVYNQSVANHKITFTLPALPAGAGGWRLYCTVQPGAAFTGLITSYGGTSWTYTTGLTVSNATAAPGANGAATTLVTTIASFQSAGQVTLAATATTTVSAAHIDWGTDDTVSIQQAFTSATPVSGEVDIPSVKVGYMISDNIVNPGNVHVRGGGCVSVFAASSANQTVEALPTVAPYLQGAVLIQTATGKDGLVVNASSPSCNHQNLGVRFTNWFAGTGHGFNFNPPVKGAKQDMGLYDSYVNQLKVFGHDGNHYGFNYINFLYNIHLGLKSYGGGHINLSENSGDSIHCGNETFVNCYGAVVVAGSANGINNSATVVGGINFTNWSRPQVWVMDISTCPDAALAKLVIPTSQQFNWWANQANVQVITIAAPDMESTVGSTSLFPTNGANILGMDQVAGQQLSNKFSSFSGANVALVVQGQSGQISDLFQVRYFEGAGTKPLWVDSNGVLHLDHAIPIGAVSTNVSAPAIYGNSGAIYVKSAAGQGVFLQPDNGATMIAADVGSKIGFYGATTVTKPAVTGAKGSNAALGSLMTALAALGLVTDSTTA